MTCEPRELNQSLTVVLDLHLELAEGPIWDAETRALVFVDGMQGLIYRFRPDTGALATVAVSHRPEIGAAIPRRLGGYAVSSTEGVLAVEPTGASALLVPVERDRPLQRMNDAKCDSRGRMVSGTFSRSFERGAGALYRIDPDRSVSRLQPGISVSNGIGWSPDETILYHVDTLSRGVDCFDYDIATGAVTNRRRFVAIAREAGLPDGLAVDAEGHVWVALYLATSAARCGATRPTGSMWRPSACPLPRSPAATSAVPISTTSTSPPHAMASRPTAWQGSRTRVRCSVAGPGSLACPAIGAPHELPNQAMSEAGRVATGRDEPAFEAIVIGAGVCGIYQAYRLQEMGVRFVVLERAADVGGTWYWNRYPGCRFDSESETYGYSFSEDLLQEWDWTERFAPREETERYLHHVVGKFGLREHMRFGAEVLSAQWNEAALSWTVGLADGQTLTCRFLLTAIGLLSTPTPPRYAGVDSFAGQSFHTYHYPREGVDFGGKRVAVIGTGATGVQLISAIADQVGSLTVFQRRPNWCAPLNNAPVTYAEMQEIKTRYPAIFAQCRATPSGFVHDTDRRKVADVPDAEREAYWERLYAGSGFGIWLGNFSDVLVDPDANAVFSRFVERKIRARVKDPAIAEKLVPKDHGFGTRRVPMETRYYEVYNRDNVALVDIGETPIERITPTGVRTVAEDFAFDIIIYATGFDAVTGAFERIDFVGRDGLTLRDKWHNGPMAAFGVALAGFPNLITVAGPLSGSVATNFPRGIEEAVDWSTGLLRYARAHGFRRIEATEAAEEEWGAHVEKMAEKILFARQQSWFTGYNSNVDRQYQPKCIVYAGGAHRYRRAIGEQAANGYPAFHLD